ncbi:unnamed protein product [Arctogadus glacialis]
MLRRITGPRIDTCWWLAHSPRCDPRSPIGLLEPSSARMGGYLDHNENWRVRIRIIKTPLCGASGHLGKTSAPLSLNHPSRERYKAKLTVQSAKLTQRCFYTFQYWLCGSILRAHIRLAHILVTVHMKAAQRTDKIKTAGFANARA